MKSYTIFEILRGQEEFACLGKLAQSQLRLSRMSMLFRVRVSHKINSEEEKSPCPAGASRKRSHRYEGNIGA